MIEKLKPEAVKVWLLQIFAKLGVNTHIAAHIADILLMGELLGHRTHGLHLVKPYIEHIKNGQMNVHGQPIVLNHTLATELWDGDYIAGPYLIHTALKKCSQMAQEYGTGTIVIQKSSHIGCLAAYMEEATANGDFVLIACSDPANATVAPFGGTEGVYSPNPLALGIPTEGDPIILDISMSATSNGLVHQKKAKGELLPHPWLLDQHGQASDDPAVFYTEPAGTILPLGGMDSGYKGFALGIMIEAMTSALGGHGRIEKPDRWGASVFVQVINTQKFSGTSPFQREMEHFKKQCLASKAIHPEQPVRIPGQKALENKRKQSLEGLDLLPETRAALQVFEKEFDVWL